MKAAHFALAALLAFATTFSHAQTLVEKLYIMRVDTTSMDPYSGMTHTCVLLYPDGHYRMERSFQSAHGGDPETKVYLDTLPALDLKALQGTLDDATFQQIKTAPPHGGIIKDMDVLNITVPREHLMQQLNFNNAAERKPFDKELKPFLNSLKNLEKRKVAIAKTEKSDNCSPPRVMYRSSFTPGSNGDDHPQP